MPQVEVVVKIVREVADRAEANKIHHAVLQLGDVLLRDVDSEDAIIVGQLHPVSMNYHGPDDE